MKKKGIALLLTLLLGLTCFLAACAPKEFTFTLTFYNDVEGTEVLDTLTATRQETLDPTEKIPHNSDERFEFAGWFIKERENRTNRYIETDFSAKNFSDNARTNIDVFPRWVKKGSIGIVYDLMPNDTYKVSGIGSFAGSELVIPETYEGKTVSSIGTDAFKDCTQLIQVTLPDSIKQIMAGAFRDCKNIRSFVMPDSLNLAYIGENSFSGCDNVVFYTSSSDSDKNILNGWGNWNPLNRPVYYDVEYIYENKITDEETGTTKVDYEYILTNNAVSSGAANDGSSQDNSDASDNTEVENDFHIYLTRYVGDEEEVEIALNYYTNEGVLNIGENATLHIGAYAFGNTDVKIVFPTIEGQTGGIGELDDYAFAGYLGESIDIPGSVTAIDSNVFYDTAAKFSIENIGLRSLGNYFFAGYKGEKIEIPSSVVTLGQYVFSEAVSEIEFAEDCKITHLGAYSFANYMGETLTVPASVTEIDGFAFVGATAHVSLENVTLANNTLVRHAFINYEGTQVTLPASLEIIGERAFNNSSYIQYITIPDSVKEIGNDAFFGCDSLVEFSIGNMSNENDAFEVEDGVLYTKGKKTLLSYPASKSGDSFTVPDEVTAIASGAFRNAKNLVTVKLNENLTSIGDSAFENCENIDFILIPEKVTTMGENVFKGCSSLKIAISGEEPENWKGFNPDGCEVIENSKDFNVTEDYEYLQLNDGWAIMNYKGNATSIVVTDYEGGKITEIGPGAFSGKEIESITLPESVTKIGANAFRNSKLNSITANGVNSIGAYAFEGTNITSIDMPKLSSIGIGAFKNSKLSHITFSDNLTELPNNVFDGTKFTEFTVPSQIESIGDEVFANNNLLTSIVIEPWINEPEEYDPNDTNDKDKKVQTIGRGILKGCTAVTDISIGFIGRDRTSNERLNSYLFGTVSGVQKLSVTLTGEFYNRLPGDWFTGADNLVKITLPAKVSEISSAAFANCISLTEIVFGGKITRIQERAFSGCSSLQTIDLKDVEYIGEEAFKGCTVLNGLTLSDRLSSLNRSAFADCKSLTEITIPSSVSIIPERCFSGCVNLVSVNFSGSVNNLGARVFENCAAIKTLNLKFENNAVISANAFTGCGSKEAATTVSIDAPLQTLPANSFEGFLGTSVTLSTNFVRLDRYAFKDSVNLVSVTASGVTAMADYVFDGCLSLETFDMSRVTSMSSYVFQNCESLDNITFNNNIKSTDAADAQNPSTLPVYTFAGCTSLKNVKLGTGINTIGHHAFLGCSALKEIDISNITRINGYAFMDCTNLQKMEIGRNIYLGGYVFNGCTKIIVYVSMEESEARNVWDPYYSRGCSRFIYNGKASESLYVDNSTNVVYERETVNGSLSDYYVLTAFAGEGSLTIQSTVNGRSVTKVGANAFAGVDGLTSVTLPASITEIGDSAFAGCVDLTSVTAPGVTTLGVGVFSGCVQLNTVQLNALSFVPARTFENCEALTTIDIKVGTLRTVTEKDEEGNSITVTLPFIEADAFANVTADINFDGNNIILGEYAMRNYKGEEFDLNNVSEIGKYAFSGSTAKIIFKTGETEIKPYQFAGYLGESLELPSTITTIGASAFADCTALTELSLPAAVTSIGAKAFENLTIEITFDNNPLIKEIGAGAFSGYLGERLNIPTTVSSLGAGVFENAKNFINITIPSSVTSIGDNAFSGCSALANIHMQGDLTSLGAGAFANCISLFLVDFDGTALTEIKEMTFYNCSALTDITIPSSVTSLGARAFFGCARLDSISLPAGISKIGDFAFSMCSALTTVTIPASVETIGDGVFANCTAFEGIEVDAQNKNFSEADGVLYNFDKTELICYPAAKTGESYDVLDSVSKIRAYAFAYNTALTEVYISDKVTTVGSKAFFGCVNIVVHCASISKPAGYASDWNFCIGNKNQTDYCSVIWAYKK